MLICFPLISACVSYFSPSFPFSVQISSTIPMVRRSRSESDNPTSRHRRRNSAVVISRLLLRGFFLASTSVIRLVPQSSKSPAAPHRWKTYQTARATHRSSSGWSGQHGRHSILIRRVHPEVRFRILKRDQCHDRSPRFL